MATPEPGGSRYERTFEALGPLGRDAAAVIMGLGAVYFLLTALVPGPAARIAPEGIWVAGLAQQGLARSTEFIASDEILKLEVEVREFRGVKMPPYIVIHRRDGRPIKLTCDSAAEGEWFIDAADQILDNKGPDD